MEPQSSKGGYPIHDTSNLQDKSAIDCHIIIDGGKDSEGNDMVVEGEGTGFVHMAGGCGAIDNKYVKEKVLLKFPQLIIKQISFKVLILCLV